MNKHFMQPSIMARYNSGNRLVYFEEYENSRYDAVIDGSRTILLPLSWWLTTVGV